MYDELVAKVNNNDTSNFVLKTKDQTDKTELEKKFLIWLILLKKQKSHQENKENKFPDVSSLATKTAVTVVENKIPSVSKLVKKTDYNTKLTEVENKT